VIKVLQVERMKRGWTREELGRRVGASHSAIQKWEEGDRTPTGDPAKQLERVLKRPVSELVADVGIVQPKLGDT
jgi:transcriptional regulator with XRE-family HTH domain